MLHWGPAGSSYLFCLNCRACWSWEVALVQGPQQRKQLYFVHFPCLSECCSLGCPFSSVQTAAGWREGPARALKKWIPSDILDPAEHLCGQKGKKILKHLHIRSISALVLPSSQFCTSPPPFNGQSRSALRRTAYPHFTDGESKAQMLGKPRSLSTIKVMLE